MNFFAEVGRATLDMMLDSSLYLLIGFTLAGILAWIAPRGYVVRFMGGGGILSSLRGAMVAAPLPLCSCSVVPTTAALRDQGASKGAAMAFLISGPETGADSIALTYALMGPYMAVIRPVAALASGILGGVLADSLEPSRRPHVGPADGEKADEAKEPCNSPAGDNGGDATTGRTFSGAMRYAFDGLLMEVAPWLIAGVLFAGIISALLPDDFFERILGTGLFSMVIMILLGIPMYVCASSSTPLAVAMMANGLNPGAALVFLLAGPATNLGTIGVVVRIFGRKVALAYIGAISLVSILFGWCVNFLESVSPDTFFPISGGLDSTQESGLLFAAKIAGGILLFSFIGVGFARRGKKHLVSMKNEYLEAATGNREN